METHEVKNRILKMASETKNDSDWEVLYSAFRIIEKYEKIEKITLDDEDDEEDDEEDE